MVDSQRGTYRRVGYNHRIYPTSARGIIVLLKRTQNTENSSLLYSVYLQKQTSFSLFLIFSRRVQLPYLESMA